MDTVTVDGKTYVRAAKAAALVGYTPDYIGQLCRKGAVEGIVLGKTWYVREKSLLDHRHSKTRVNTATTKRDIAKQRNVLQTEAIARTSVPAYAGYRKHVLDTQIAYEPDTHELLPVVASQGLPSVEETSLSPNGAYNSDDGDLEGMSTDTGEGEASQYEAIEIGEDEGTNRKSSSGSEDEIAIQIRKMATAPRRDASLAREAYRTRMFGSTGDAHLPKRSPSLGEEGEERIVAKPRRNIGAAYRPILVCALFFLFLLAALVFESTWTYTDESSEYAKFETTYNLASIHTIVEILK